MPIILRENEQLVKVVRKHSIFFVPVFFTWPWIIVAFFGVHYLAKFDFLGYWSLVITTVIVIVFLIILYRYYIWRMDALIITSQRVVESEQRGIFSKTITELLYQDILEISYDKEGVNASLYNYGDIKIRTASQNEIVINKIPEPDNVLELINTLRQGGKPATVQQGDHV